VAPPIAMTDFARFSLGRLSAATIVKIRAHGCTATGRTLLERQQATVHLVDDLGVALSTLVNCAAHDVYYHSSRAT
jgi:hypothetical protein